MILFLYRVGGGGSLFEHLRFNCESYDSVYFNDFVMRLFLKSLCLAFPCQVVALTCGMFTAFLMILTLLSSSWLQTTGWRQGLFEHCIAENAPKPLPFETEDETGCHPARGECK